MTAPQRIAEAIGKEGCYFLSLLRLAETELGDHIDLLDAYGRAIGAGAMREDCYILDGGAILETYLPGAWAVTHESADYKPKPGELEILRYDLAGASHFVVGDGSGRVAFDPYGDSRTVREGRLVSKRIARRVA
ncbi:MAG: DUF261 family protein [Spirochaetaceae bacterium]|nr:DUF261 family protein [Spirochaetaceae bacterium]